MYRANKQEGISIMATRARIGLELADGTITTSYHHWDGYPAGLGFNLVNNWNTAEKIAPAIALGDASHWADTIVKAIKDGIATGDLSTANEAWRELTDTEKQLLWKAPSKGGVRYPAWRAAHCVVV